MFLLLAWLLKQSEILPGACPERNEILRYAHGQNDRRDSFPLPLAKYVGSGLVPDPGGDELRHYDQNDKKMQRLF